MTTSKPPLGEFSIPVFSTKLNGDFGNSKSARNISIALICGEMVGGIGVAVEIGSGVNVGGIGDDVLVGETGKEVTAGAHPLIDTVINTNGRITDITDLFTFYPY
jgi:hypothetical protein